MYPKTVSVSQFDPELAAVFSSVNAKLPSSLNRIFISNPAFEEHP
jgi:hypothetical protein